METVMSNKVRDASGKFAPKSEVPRLVRSVNLTDDALPYIRYNPLLSFGLA
jgi:hypothetical protein